MMNLLTNYDTTVRAMAEVENDPAWLKQTLEPYHGDAYTLKGCMVKIHKPEIEALRERGYENAFWTIYGAGGWNRWHVKADGTVVFSKHHGALGAAEKAAALGFTIW